MKLLIAIKSCLKDSERGCHSVIRETWGRDAKALGIDVKFFIGDNFKKVQSDEVILDCPDDYHNLSKKTREICKWVAGKVFDFIFFCDTDTFIIPKLLLSCGFQHYDYAGRFGTEHPIGTIFKYQDCDGVTRLECRPWASGGIGYFLSKKAIEIIAETEPNTWIEDLWVGQIMGPLIQSGKITAWDIPEMECNISWHFPQRVYKSQYNPKFHWQEQMYAEHK